MARKPSRPKVISTAADTWKNFYWTPEGKIAIGLLFREFGFYDTPNATDTNTLIRSIGQRDVLLRITQMINLQPEQAPVDDRDTSDPLDQMMRSTPYV